MHHPRAIALALSLFLGPAIVAAGGDGPGAEPIVVADFTLPGHRWDANRSLSRLDSTDRGLTLRCSGADPYLVGPVVAVPFAEGTRRLVVELDADAGGEFRCFAAAEGADFTEDHAVQLVAEADGLRRGVLPALGRRMRFRLDPPDGTAPITLRRLRVAALVPRFSPIVHRAAAPLELPADAITVRQGAVAVGIDPTRLEALVVSVGGHRMADGDPDDVPVGLFGDRAFAVVPAAGGVVAQRVGAGVELAATVREPGESPATWRLVRRIRPAERGVEIETTIAVDRPRELVHLPWLTLLAGRGTFGASKSQALLPGVEYLGDEPSSNEKELGGAAANRLLVDPAKICSPSMVLAAGGRWLAVDWKAGGVPASPLFDSPDRRRGSGGHLLGLLSPAASTSETMPPRFDGDLDVYRGVRLEANEPVGLVVTLRGGAADTVLPAISEGVRTGGLPPLPEVDGDDAGAGLAAACRLLAHGWLDSAARDSTRWRHAVWEDRFAPQPAADVPGYLLWLAAHVDDRTLADRLRTVARETVAALPPGATGGVGHLSRPSLPLLLRPGRDADQAVTDALAAAASSARAAAEALIAAEGRARYVPGKTDYSVSLGADHCNGYTALRAEAMLEAAALGGDEEAIRMALAALDLVARAHPAGEVPRGAQPWEMPLHTPDLLAAARLARCHTLGHLLDGGPQRLEEARRWAWSGVPFVYLRDPLPGPVGRYATIGVLGATDGVAPVWIGQPVQWCGLVYSGALHDLARADADGAATWRTLARGITRAGLRMTFPADDPSGRGGLLPDYWLFRSGRGDGPAINPGTLQATLAEAFEATPLVTATRIDVDAGHVLHLPGGVRREVRTAAGLAIDLAVWPEEECRLILTRVATAPRRVTWRGREADARLVGGGCLSVTIGGGPPSDRAGTLEIEW